MVNTVGYLKFLLIILLGLGSACAHIYTARGVYYRVQKGDTLATISKKYRLDLQELAEINNIQNDQGLKAGKSLYIPGVTVNHFAGIMEQEGKPTFPKKEGKREKVQASLIPSSSPSKSSSSIEFDRGKFIWPLKGEISSLFGMRRGRRHDGVDIRARQGTMVMAAADGEVVFSKRMRGYGNLILVKHKEDFFTVYAHNSVNLVKKGVVVKKGEVIAKVGRTGRASGPHLHFEVRERAKARNPLFFLPKTEYAQGPQEKGVDYGGADEEVEIENP